MLPPLNLYPYRPNPHVEAALLGCLIVCGNELTALFFLEEPTELLLVRMILASGTFPFLCLAFRPLLGRQKEISLAASFCLIPFFCCWLFGLEMALHQNLENSYYRSTNAYCLLWAIYGAIWML